LASRLDFNASIALKHQGLMSFGTASWIQDDTLGFTADAELEVGEKAEMRLELTGLPDTVLADIVVVKARQDPRSEAFRYAARIAEMTAGDRELLDHWVDERSAGSTSFTAERMMASLTASVVSRAGPTRGGAAREAREERRARKRATTESKAPRSSQTWTPSSSTGPAPERGRARINQALRTSLDPKESHERKDLRDLRREEGTAPSDSRSVASTWSTSSVYSTTSVASKETLFDPAVAWEQGDPRAEVTWHDPKNLIRDWKTHLCNKALPLPMELPHPKRGTRLTLRLKLPDGQALAVRARVMGRAGRTVLCAIDLSPGVRHKLKRATRAAALADPQDD